MTWFDSRRWCVVLPALLLAASVGCCCPRKGLVLRGDWSLELNRVPHMRSNGPSYDADCCAPGCTSCTSTTCVDGQYLSGADAGAYGGHDGHGGHGGRYVVGQGRGGLLHGADGYYAGDEGPAPPEPTPPAFARFHPVPTRPVFEPQTAVAYDPSIESPPVPQREQLPPPQGTSHRRGDATDDNVGAAAASEGADTIASSEDDGDTSVDAASLDADVHPASWQAPEVGSTPRMVSKPQKNSVQWKVSRHRA